MGGGEGPSTVTASLPDHEASPQPRGSCNSQSQSIPKAVTPRGTGPLPSTTPPPSRCPGIGCRVQKRQLRPRKFRLLSQDHVTRKAQTDEAIDVEKSNALDGFLFPWPPTKPGSWATSQGLPTARVLGPGCGRPRQCCFTVVALNCWLFHL